MAEAAVAAPIAESRGPGLFSRLIGVLFSPRATYAAVVARPRVLGAFVVTIAIMAITEGAFFSTQVMQEVLLDQQIKTIESFGVTINDQAYERMEQGIGRAAYTTPIFLAIFVPIIAAIFAAIILGVWGMLMGGIATFKQVYAILAHSGMVLAIAVLFAMPLSYATHQMAGANLSVFAPMVEEMTFLGRLLAGIDLFYVWWCVNIAIGVGVLFKRKTSSVAMTFIGAYVLIVLILALVRSGS